MRKEYQYPSLIGSLQWAVSLGRLDIMTAVTSFCTIPRKGHLERVKAYTPTSPR